MPSAHTPLGICIDRESDINLYLHSSEEDMKAHLLTAATILVVSAVLIALATSAPAAPTPAASASGTPLGPVDTYFVTQTSLGTPFQVDAGRVALAKGTTQAIRSVSVQIYLDDISQFQEVNGIYKEYYKTPLPSRTTVQIAKLSLGAHIEISAIAHK